MLLTVEITKYVPPGTGFAIHQGKAVFVPATAVGDIVKVFPVKEKKNHIIARLHEVVTASHDRINVPCPHYDLCGGCSLMHLSYEKQLQLKLEMLKEVLNNQGVSSDVSIVPAEQLYKYRYRTQLKCQDRIVGFSQRNSNTVTAVNQCRILADSLMGQYGRLEKLFANKRDYHLLASSKTQQVSCTVLEGGQKSVLPGSTATVIENYGFGDLELESGSFAQSNPGMVSLIAKDLFENLKNQQKVCELYCGSGTFSLAIAQKADSLIGYEIDKNAVEQAIKNTRRNELPNCEFKAGNIEKLTLAQEIDTIVADPPRTGLAIGIIHQILKSRVNEIFYLSCNPTTMARDLRVLTQEGRFKIRRLTGYDMYCHSTHLEALAILQRDD